MDTKSLTIQEFQKILKVPIPDFIKERLEKLNLTYRLLTPEELNTYYEEVINFLLSKETVFAGEHRKNDWDKGWEENLQLFLETGKLELLVPKYHGKYKIARWNSELIYSDVPLFDFELHKLVVDTYIYNYLKDSTAIYEFGCGTGYNLLRIHEYLPQAKLVGLDWAASTEKIINLLNIKYPKIPIEGHHFDFFNPPVDIKLYKNSDIITIAALEQTEDRFELFLQYLLNKKPRLCVHFEPIEELLNPRVTNDLLSIMYFRKRKYLHKFLTRLRELEKGGKLQIIAANRTFSGSKFIEGHSLIVWKPI